MIRMKFSKTGSSRPTCATRLCHRAFAAVFVPLVVTGCGEYTIRIEQHRFINTAMHRGREASKQTGEPLEVNVVCVTPEDLKKGDNDRLKPGSGITSLEWFATRQEVGGQVAGKFSLPSSQIYILANDTGLYGLTKGRAMAGAVEDKTSVREIAGIVFPKKPSHRNSAIYVFPKFLGPDRAVLPTKPVMFSPPSKYGRLLEVEIGVRPGEGAPHYGQFIRRKE